ncbi:methyltransferase domain-containing protein [Streptomyces sp. x-80]|uniref:methyltransferase domain-containing protein n=1 Tax=Streptomyces sp. x-80 TaxID=2789282 RepID=UPI00397FF91B
MVQTMYGVPRPDPIGYLGQVAATGPGRAYKAYALAALELRPGLTVVDAGCGPGTDLGALADAVTRTGSVIGVDHDPVMLGEARRRTAGRAGVEVLAGEAQALPVADDAADRARADRVLMHVAEPARVVAELRRVVRPGGLVALTEPDWDTLTVDPGEVETGRAFNRFVCGSMVRHATIGRRLARLAAEAGLEVVAARVQAPTLHDFATADRVLGLRRNAERAVNAGELDAEAARSWLAGLAGPHFSASFMLYAVTARVPG